MPAASFPADFLWGVATAGHQNEGDNVDSDTWFLENVTPTVFQDRSGKADERLGAVGVRPRPRRRAWASTPTASRSSGRASSRSRASSRKRRWRTTRRVVDGCLARGLAPIVTFNHFTSPHWFAARGAWLDPEAPELFARYCGVVMDRFGDRIALAVTFNEPDLPEMLTWAELPDFIPELERATLEAASEAAGVEQYRAGNVMLREDFAGMRAGHDGRPPSREGRHQGPPPRPAASGCRSPSSTTSPHPAAKSCGIASAPRSTSTGSSWLATTTSSACRTTSASSTVPTARWPRPRATTSTGWAPRSSPIRSAAPSSTCTR